MIQGILNTALPTIRTACFATAGVLLGHKVALAAGCKVGAIYAEHMGQADVEEWNQASSYYLMQAKKDAVRDLTLATAIAGVGLTVGSVGDYLTTKPDSIYTYAEKMMNNIEKLETKTPAEALSSPLTLQLAGRSALVYFVYQATPKLGILAGIVGALDFIRIATKA
jgi:hypothetical protein